MSSQDNQDQEPHASASPPSDDSTKGANRRRSFANARRELSEKELSTPAVQKLLIDEVERLEQEHSEACQFRDKYYEADKKVGILEEKHRRVISQEIISNGTLAIGAATLGYLPSLKFASISAFMCAIFGLVLIACGIWAKVVRL